MMILGFLGLRLAYLPAQKLNATFRIQLNGAEMNTKSIAQHVTLFVVLIALGSFGNAARADVVYEYRGNNFTSFYNPYSYTSDDSLSGSLAFASALGDNLNLA